VSGLRDAADMLSVGAELLTEFADWIEEGGPRTFGEWLLKVDCPEDERPPVASAPAKEPIITPPPCPHHRTSTNMPPRLVNSAGYRITCLDCPKVMTEAEYNIDRRERHWNGRRGGPPMYDPIRAANEAMRALHRRMTLTLVAFIPGVEHMYAVADDSDRFICKTCKKGLRLDRADPIDVRNRRLQEWVIQHGPNVCMLDDGTEIVRIERDPSVAL